MMGSDFNLTFVFNNKKENQIFELFIEKLQEKEEKVET